MGELTMSLCNHLITAMITVLTRQQAGSLPFATLPIAQWGLIPVVGQNAIVREADQH